VEDPHGDADFADQLSLIGLEADVYEAVATLEYLGRPLKADDITSATGSVSLDEPAVLAALDSLTDRGMLTVIEQDGEPVYEPAFRGWSAAPNQSAGPHR
jgi:DNA-binding transcriptional ArsR family regulator